MPRQNRDRDRWEAYFMMILLATRPILLFGGLLMLVYAIVAMMAYPVVGGVALGLALLLFLMVFYERVLLWVARLGALIVTLGRH